MFHLTKQKQNEKWLLYKFQTSKQPTVFIERYENCNAVGYTVYRSLVDKMTRRFLCTDGPILQKAYLRT